MTLDLLRSLSLTGWLAVFTIVWLVARALAAVYVEARAAWLAWLARSDCSYARGRRDRHEAERCGRILVFHPQPMPRRWEPNPRDPSPTPRKRVTV